MKISTAVAFFVFSVTAQTIAASLPALLPEFKTPEQLKKVSDRASKAQNNGNLPVFYTGKPSEEESSSYLFKYRFYNADIVRWTSVDPTGFIDGPNNSAYRPVPTMEFDYQGLYVSATYTITERKMRVVNSDNSLSIRHFENLHSGDDEYGDYLEENGPIPPGAYNIYSRTDGIGGSPAFILDPDDSTKLNDQWDNYPEALNRDGVGFRIHLTGTTTGCITMASDELDRLLSFINSTGIDTSTTHLTSPGSPSSFDGYYMGTLTVVE